MMAAKERAASQVTHVLELTSATRLTSSWNVVCSRMSSLDGEQRMANLDLHAGAYILCTRTSGVAEKHTC